MPIPGSPIRSSSKSSGYCMPKIQWLKSGWLGRGQTGRKPTDPGQVVGISEGVPAKKGQSGGQNSQRRVQTPLGATFSALAEENLGRGGKEKKGRWLVRITNLPQKTHIQIRHDLELVLGEELDKVQSTINGVMVVCPDSKVQQKLLALDGWLMDEKTMRVSRMESTLSGDDICEYITEQLLTESKLQNLQTNLLGPKLKEVQQVQKGEKGSQLLIQGATNPQLTKEGDQLPGEGALLLINPNSNKGNPTAQIIPRGEKKQWRRQNQRR